MSAAAFIDPERRETAVGQGTLRVGAGEEGAALPLRSTAVEATVSGRFADVVVKQQFSNDRAHAIEATYVFPIAIDASVYRLRFRIGERTIEGVVKAKEEARRDYEVALAEGRAATLVEEDRPSLLTLSIANIAPGATIEVELAYQELVPFDDGVYRFTFPMTAPPRHRQMPPAADGVVPPRPVDESRAPDVTIAVRFDDAPDDLGPSLRSSSHPLVIDRPALGALRVVLGRTNDGSLANRDFALEWPGGSEGVRTSVQTERKAGEPGTVLVTIVPSRPRASTEPQKASALEMQSVRCGNCGAPITDLSAIKEIPGLGPVVPCTHCRAILTPGTDIVMRASRPRDVLFLIDRSASMRGLEANVEHALSAVFAALSPKDAAQVVVFDHDREALEGDAKRFFAVSPELADRARDLLRRSPPRGGSELSAALALSSASPAREGRSRIVVLVSDVSVGDSAKLLPKVRELIGANARLAVLAVGPSVDRPLATRLARAGGGFVEVLAPGALSSDSIARFARRVASAGPTLTDVAIHWNGAAVQAALPTPIPDLHEGEALTVAARYGDVGRAQLVVTGLSAGGTPFRQEIDVDLPETARVVGLGRLWARRRLDVLGSDEANKREAEQLGLAHSIVGPWTSLVAVDSEVSVAKKTHRRGLIIVNGHTMASVDGQRFVIGRYPSPSNQLNLVLDSERVSRRHAEIIFDGEGFVIRDLASTNGTRIDGEEIRVARLKDYTGIKIADVLITFRFVTKSDPFEPFFEYVPVQRGVDAASGESGRKDVAVTAAPNLGHEPPRAPAPRASPVAARAVAPAVVLRSPRAEVEEIRSARRDTPLPPSAAFAPPPGAPPMPMAMSPSPMAGSPMPGAMMPAAMMPMMQSAPAEPPHRPVAALTSEPYPEHEILWLNGKTRGELDLVFLVDATASMGKYIKEAVYGIGRLTDALASSPLCKSIRFALVAYRDHPPQDMTFVTRIAPFASDPADIRTALDQLEAKGGGDDPEAVTDGLYDVVRLPWRPNATRVVVWFGDAPPHGVEPKGDAFPNGCPCGHQWFTQAESLREMGISVYAVGCLPAVRSYVSAEEVYRTIARVTRGMYLPLREAEFLGPFIAGLGEEALDGERIDAHVHTLIASHAAALANADPDDRVRWFVEELARLKVRVRALDTDRLWQREVRLIFRDANATDVRASLTRLASRGPLPW